MFHTKTTAFLDSVQESYEFSDLEMARLKYTLKALSSEFIKTLLMAFLFYKLGHLPQFIAAIFILTSIRWNCGGLHLEHFTTCLLFTTGFMVLSVLILPEWITVPLPIAVITLLLCIAATYLIGPVSSRRRPVSSPESQHHYRNITVFVLVIYSILIFLLKTNPYADICYWIIVLQTIQLISAAIQARKGEMNETI